MHNYFKIISIVLILFMVQFSAFASQSAIEDFEKGNSLYKEKKYEQAIQSYMKVIESGFESDAIYFNLGNGYFKNGDLGHAILYYLKAKRLMPSNENIDHNLNFAQQFTSVQMEGIELNPVGALLDNFVASYTLNLLGWVSSFMFILFITMLILKYGLVMINPVLNVLTILSLSVFIVVASLTTYKYQAEYVIRRAVIISEESTILTGPSEQSDREFEGSPGLVVEILSESGEYVNVIFSNKRRGWIAKNALEEI